MFGDLYIDQAYRTLYFYNFDTLGLADIRAIFVPRWSVETWCMESDIFLVYLIRADCQVIRHIAVN